MIEVKGDIVTTCPICTILLYYFNLILQEPLFYNQYHDKLKLIFNCFACLCFALMSCISQIISASEMESRTDQGLVKGHAYSIIGLEEVQLCPLRVNADVLFFVRQELFQ